MRERNPENQTAVNVTYYEYENKVEAVQPIMILVQF